VKSTIHWVSAQHALDFEARLYNDLFRRENAGEENEPEDFTASINPNSLEVRTSAKIEPSVKGVEPGSRYQFERIGYFCVDKDSTSEKLVFNRTVTLRDTWAKIEKSQRAS
jgi:glutaminyl-tRNA synthetase